ncbi:heavy metal translocating P-type ATPase [Pedobacter hartonius]|uniref:Cu2+-exporting ATPase n=1 Tax=Pedobacter hartonius TaxID=425514 RepID=A0A1H4B5E6_9SPHI|nr:heavy metal translocating P-type ATPase [Pedobacter hartonius]SEA43286.1 Cu2+-exporting ATPase [Pedobacter hartonius]
MSAPDLQTVSLPVLGMTCAGCASSVQSILNAQPGIETAEVNYATQQVRIAYRPQFIKPAQFKETLQSVGYDVILDKVNATAKQAAAQEESYSTLKTRTILAAVLTLPVVIIGMFLMDIPYANYYMLVLTTPVLFVFGKNFFINAFKQARHHRANMDSLVALSTGISYLFSVFNTFYPEYWHSKGIHPHVYYEAAAVVIVFIMLGKLLEENAKSNTSSAIKKLIGLQPNTVIVIGLDGEKEIEISAVKTGDLLLVRPGDKIPVDGKVYAGSSYVDESLISGEPVAVLKENGNSVFAGTINQKGSFRFYAEKVGSDTVLAQIIRLVQEAQGSRAPVQKSVDKIAGIFVPVVLFIALLTFGAWLTFGGEYKLSQGLMAMVTVLVIACPCALGLATPTAIMVGIGKGAETGILIKGAEALETGYKVNAVVLDKTGTLTQGRPAVTAIKWAAGQEVNSRFLLGIFLAMEQQSEHPLAAAVVSFLKGQAIEAQEVSAFKSITGIGVEAQHRGEFYFAGSDKVLFSRQIVVPAELSAEINDFQQHARTLIYFTGSSKILAVMAIADELKEGSKEAVNTLQAQGIAVYMLTGDNNFTAAAVARDTGIEHYRAEVLPSEKADFIKDLQRQGRVVAMIGDGINDSEALAQADLSIAMGRGSDIAMDVAKLTLISSDLRLVPRALKLSHATVRTIRQNLFWAFIYNLIGIPLAAGILYPVNGFLLNPMIAGAAMALSSVSVVSNSLRLKLIRLRSN